MLSRVLLLLIRIICFHYFNELSEEAGFLHRNFLCSLIDIAFVIHSVPVLIFIPL